MLSFAMKIFFLAKLRALQLLKLGLVLANEQPKVSYGLPLHMVKVCSLNVL